jgi:hypothetical protein
MTNKQQRVVALMIKKKLIRQAKKIKQLTPIQFDELMKITWNNNLYGTDCYRFLSQLEVE